MIRAIIHRKTMVSMFFLGISFLGIISYYNLPVELLPQAELPYLMVSVQGRQDLDPSYMERQAIIPLEAAIGTLEDIEELESYADRRSGQIFVKYNIDADMKFAYLHLAEKIDQVKLNLEKDFNVQVFKTSTDQINNMLMNLQIRGSGGVDRLRYITEREIREKLETIDGVANVEIFGGQDKSVEIIVNDHAMQSYGITTGRLQTLLARNNPLRIYAGTLQSGHQKFSVGLTSDYLKVEELGSIMVDARIPLYLKDVAKIRFGLKEETSISRVNGKEAITLQIIRDTQVNMIELAHQVRETIAYLNNRLASEDVQIVVEVDSSETLEANFDLIKQLALYGGFLAVLILWFFLRKIRLVSVIALAIPISILTSLNFFYFFEITLNSLTLVGMALAIGMLIDNSIVVLENIYRLYESGMDAEEAVVQGSAEVFRPIIASTLTTITVFLPFMFTDNYLIRLIGYQIGVSIISALCVSLVIALFLIPMVSHYYLRRLPATDYTVNFNKAGKTGGLYLVILKAALRKPLVTIVSALILFFMTLALAIFMSVSAPRETELDYFNLYVSMPAGSNLETTDQAVTNLEGRLKDVEEIQDVISQIYEEEAILTLRLKEDYKEIKERDLAKVKELVSDRTRRQRDIDVDFEQPESSSRFRGGGSRGGGGDGGGAMGAFMGIGAATEHIVLKGMDYDQINMLARDISDQLEELTSVRYSRVGSQKNRPEVHLQFDRTLMEYAGITPNEVRSELNAFERETTAGIVLTIEDEDYEVIIKNETLEDKGIDDLHKLNITGEEDAEYSLQDISRIIVSEGKGQIRRINQERQIEIRYAFTSETNESASYLEAARLEVDDVIGSYQIPAGIAIEVIHEDSELSDFYFLIPIAILLIYMILASVFESFQAPTVIMFTIPLAAIGSLLAIVITGLPLMNVNTMVGLLILLGIVVNNGIILIDYINLLRRRGYTFSRAVIAAGLARLRPIFITAISTIIAMLPLAMGQAEYVTQIAAPFAITVIGGLSVSTLFTLVFLPTVFSGMESFLSWYGKLSSPLKTVMLGSYAGLALLIVFRMESLMYQAMLTMVALFAVPGLIYLILSSVRQARADLIPADTPIEIKIKNLYKIYEYPSKFVRDWRKYRRQVREDTAEAPAAREWLWLAAIPVFLFYFIYLFLSGGFWQFVLIHLLYFYLIFMINRLTLSITASPKKSVLNRILIKIPDFIFWGVPLLNLLYFYFSWDNLTVTIIVGIVWYFALSVFTTSNHLHRHQVNIQRITGRFIWIRKRFYGLVQLIPVIGRKKIPFQALNGVDLQIGNGMFGLLGPNGAGKTTLMRIICGVFDQSFGTIHINEFDSLQKREELQGLIGYLPQEFGVYGNMTPEEFLEYMAIQKGITNKETRMERVEYVLQAVHLMESRRQKIGSFSGGMRQRIGIAMTLLHLPKILVVDEPTAGLDPRERIRFRNLLVDLSRKRVVIFSTHIIEDISSSCDKVAVMNRGQALYVGTPHQMTSLADGKVWNLLIEPNELDYYTERYTVAHHIRVEDKLRIRCLSEEKPGEEARSAKPSLEDAYLWLAASRLSGNGV